MAPQTNIGSSTPISLGGENISRTSGGRSSTTPLRTWASLRASTTATSWRRATMVTKASNYGAREATRIGLVEVIAPTLPGTAQRDRRTKTVPKGLVLNTAGAQIDDVEMSFWQRARDFLVDPNLIALMLSIGLIGIVVELWNPGLDLPGDGRGDLADSRPLRPPGPPGLARRPAPHGPRGGVLRRRGVRPDARRAGRSAGAVMFVLGALMLFDPAGDAYQVSLPVALAHRRGTHASSRTRAHACRFVPRAARCRRRAGAGRRRGGRSAERASSSGRTASSGVRTLRTARRWSPESTFASTRVEDDLRLVVGSMSTPNEEEAQLMDVSAGLIVLVVSPRPRSPLPVRGGQDRARVRARRHLPARPPAASARRGPGLFLLIPIVDRMVKVDLRTVTLERPAAGGHHEGQRPGARERGRVLPNRRAEQRRSSQVENYMVATSQIAQTTLRSVLGQHVLDELLSERDKINAILQAIIDEATVALGHQGLRRRGQGRRDPGRHAARDGPPGRGRARAACEGHLRRGRVPGVRAAARTRRRSWRRSRSPCSCATCRRCSRSARRTTRRSSSRFRSTSCTALSKQHGGRRDVTGALASVGARRSSRLG